MLGQEQVGKIFHGHYEIIQVLGSGGMGTVFKARELSLDRIVAIKILHVSELTDDESLRRFELEAKILSALSNKHIEIFYRFGLTDERCPFIVTEYVEGPSLRSLLSDKTTLDWRRAVLIGVQICEALQYAHKSGVVHRDLKPDNIILLQHPEGDFVKLVDFGLAKILPTAEQAGQNLTRPGQLIGSVHYMSPEQCLGQHIDGRSDIYSLGCLLYEAICGQPPLTADNPVGVIYKHTNESPRPLSISSRGKKLPPELDMILTKAMAKSTADRYQSMWEFQEDLKHLLDGSTHELSASIQPQKQERVRHGARTFVLIFSSLSAWLLIMLVLLMIFYEPAIAAILAPIVETPGNQQNVYAEQALAKQMAGCGRPRAAATFYSNAYRLQEKLVRHSGNSVDILLDWSQVLDNQSARAQELQSLAVEKFSKIIHEDVHGVPLGAQEKQVLKHLVEVLSLSPAPYLRVWTHPLDDLSNRFIELRDFKSAMEIENLRQKIVEHQEGKRALKLELAEKRGSLLICMGQTRSSEQLYQATIRAARLMEVRERDLARWHAAIGRHYYDAGYTDLAIKHWQLSKTFLENPGNREPEPVALALDRLTLSEIYILEGNTGPAMPICRKTLEDLFSLPGVSEDEYLVRVKQVVDCLYAKKGYKEVVKLTQSAIKKCHQKLFTCPGPHSELLSMAGDAYCRLNKYAEAATAFEQSFSACGPVTRTNYAQVIFLIKAGMVERTENHYVKAIELLKHSLEIMEKYAPEHPLTAGVMNELSFAYQQNGQPGEALQYAEQANRVVPSGATCGPVRCNIWTRLFQLYGFFHRDELAEQYALKAMEYSAHDPGSPCVLKIKLLHDMAAAANTRNDFKKCIGYLRQRYQCISSNPEAPADDLCCSAYLAVRAELNLGNKQDARFELDRWKSLAFARDPEAERKLSDWLFLEARVLKNTNRAKEARIIYQKILERPGDTSFRYEIMKAEARADYSALLKEQPDKAEATRWLDKSRALLKNPT